MMLKLANTLKDMWDNRKIIWTGVMTDWLM